MTLPFNSSSGINGDPFKASIDRIDNTKGYIRGNIRFISHMANIARGDYSDSDLVSFCELVVKKKEGASQVSTR